MYKSILIGHKCTPFAIHNKSFVQLILIECRNLGERVTMSVSTCGQVDTFLFLYVKNNTEVFMKKQLFILLVSMLAVLCFLFGFASCGTGTEDKISFNTLTVDGENVYGKVSNQTTAFSFNQEIVEHGNAEYSVYKEITCETLIASKTFSLQVGDNTVYVLQTVGKQLTLYTVTIRRRPIYTVSFNPNGGIITGGIENQTIEEDSFASMPITTRTGYTLDRWDKALTNISNDQTLVAQWKPNQYTITFIYSNGRPNKTITQDYNTSIAKQDTPPRATDIHLTDGTVQFLPLCRLTIWP